MRQAAWNLPPGVSPGTWESFERADWADDEDQWLQGTPLTRLDEQFVNEMLPAPTGRIADLGCGAGRTSLALARRGFEVLAVDLSKPMLERIGKIAAQEKLPITCVHTNLVQLDAIESGSCAAAVCLFSTLGMIRGAEHRKQAVAEFHRILAPGGRLLLHAHQFWWNIRQYGGAAWMARHLLEALALRKVELGDRYATYRGVPNFYLHAFRSSELRSLLRGAGFQLELMRPLTGDGSAFLSWPNLATPLRAGGWLIRCRSSTK